jgi:hypothetical protein
MRRALARGINHASPIRNERSLVATLWYLTGAVLGVRAP